MKDFLAQNRKFYSADGTGGGNDDPEYIAFQKAQEFKKAIEAEVAKDAAFAELRSQGFVDKAISLYGDDLRGNMRLLKNLSLNIMKDAEKASKTAESKKNPADDVKPPVKKADLPGDPINSQQPVNPDAEKEAKMNEQVDWNNIDFDRLDKVSSLHKSMLKMITDPDIRRQARIKAFPDDTAVKSFRTNR